VLVCFTLTELSSNDTVAILQVQSSFLIVLLWALTGFSYGQGVELNTVGNFRGRHCWHYVALRFPSIILLTYCYVL